MTANRHRGAVEVTIDGTAYEMLPTFEVVAAIEEAFGGVPNLVQRILTSQHRVTEVIGVLQIALKGRVKPADIATAVLDEGAMAYTPMVGELLMNALTGGKEPDEETDPGNADAATG